jgi:hypothetical protein
MQNRHYQWFSCLLIVSVVIIVDESNALRMRTPALRLTSTLRKTAAFIKKKLNLGGNRVSLPDEFSSTLETPSIEKDDEL